MNVDKPTTLQILVAWRVNKWVVLRDAVEVGSYAYRAHAMDMARTLHADAISKKLDCYMLVREQDGGWEEAECPKPLRDSKDGAP